MQSLVSVKHNEHGNKSSQALLYPKSIPKFCSYKSCGQMASSVIQPGILVSLQELEPSSPFFKEGQSIRVTGKLQSYNVESAIAVIIDGGASLLIDTQHLRDISFRTSSIYQFIGELLIPQDSQAILKARIGRNVDGIDLNLYHQSIQLRRKFEADIVRSKTT